MTNIAENNSLSENDSPDWFLQRLVDIVNDAPLEFGLTLQVSGMLVSGTLISHKEYFEGFSTEFSNAFPYKEQAESIKSSFSSLGDLVHSGDASNRPSPLFLHLKNAHFFNASGKPIPTNQGILWRGRISQVGGFNLGLMTFDTNDN